MSSTTLDARGDTAGEERLSSWTVAAACLLLVAGGFNVIQGYTLLEHKSYLQTENVVYDNLNFWGWAFLGWGILQIAAGGSCSCAARSGPRSASLSR
jgi:uncharacterized membrane protein